MSRLISLIAVSWSRVSVNSKASSNSRCQLLSLENVSFVVPVAALNYVAGALGGKFFLGERVTAQQWAGVFLICIGVTCVFFSRR